MDATSAFTQVADQHPLMINIWGGDVGINDKATHEKLEDYMRRLTTATGSEYCFIKSNCRALVNEERLTKYCAFRIPVFKYHGWWASIAHILAMSGLIAPLTYLEGITTHYIASSYDAKSKIFDSNNDEMLNAIHIDGVVLKSVDANITRIDKAKRILDYYNKTGTALELKVCWYRKAGENCSHCEKCYRTILDILANGGNPNDFGFTVDSNTFKEIRAYLNHNYANPQYWGEIFDTFRAKPENWKGNHDLSWMLNYKLNGIGSYFGLLKKIIRNC